MLSSWCLKLSTGLQQFYDKLSILGIGSGLGVSSSAFCQSRQKLKPVFFKDAYRHLNKEFYTDNAGSISLWQGKRTLAVDGSIIDLPASSALNEEYGVAHSTGTGINVQGRLSLLFDVLNDIVLDISLSKVSVGERELAISHLTYAQEGDLILYDRGYPSFELMFEHKQRQLDFVIRAKETWSNQVKDFVASGLESQEIEIGVDAKYCKEKEYTKDSRIKVRLVRVVLESNEIEVLITSLTDTKLYPNAIFKDLYFRRWRIETRYDILKNAFKIECFSGTSQIAVEQDLYIAILVANLEAILRDEPNQELKNELTHRKYPYQVNISSAITMLKYKIVDLLLAENSDEVLAYLKAVFKKNIEPIRENRSFVRDIQKLKRRKSPKQFNNRK